jgi:hypothetical protein
MSRSVLVAVLIVALGLAALVLLFSADDSPSPEPERSRLASIRPTPNRGFGAVPERPKPQQPRANLAREVPAARRAPESAERRDSEPRPNASERSAARRNDSSGRQSDTHPNKPGDAAGATRSQEPAAGKDGGGGIITDYSPSALERALTEAGLPPAAAADVKRRYDELTMDEISLRNLATREGWADTPEFVEELDEIEAERLAIRDEIGDEAYDHYLFAVGQPNRVYVTDVMTNSPASVAGLQTSDVIVRYGGSRIFAPDDLVAETQVGNQGESIRVQITRNGEPLELEVPRGPLGVQIGVTQEPPDKLR